MATCFLNKQNGDNLPSEICAPSPHISTTSTSAHHVKSLEAMRLLGSSTNFHGDTLRILYIDYTAINFLLRTKSAVLSSILHFHTKTSRVCL